MPSSAPRSPGQAALPSAAVSPSVKAGNQLALYVPRWASMCNRAVGLHRRHPSSARRVQRHRQGKASALEALQDGVKRQVWATVAVWEPIPMAQKAIRELWGGRGPVVRLRAQLRWLRLATSRGPTRGTAEE